jgi:lysophospholipid acyltransferase (LPLAT)-like uncharacterized protein
MREGWFPWVFPDTIEGKFPLPNGRWKGYSIVAAPFLHRWESMLDQLPSLSPTKPLPKSRAEDSAFRFSSLASYPFMKRLSIRAADLAFYGLINIIGRTVRFEVVGRENHDAATADGGLPIYSFWHDDILLATYFWRRRNIVVMTSQSFDGEYIARFIQRFGYGAARGSSTRGGVGALIEMIRQMRAGHPAAFTVDGPKGPRHTAKMGAVLLAKKTGQPILPFTITPGRRWTLTRSWDRFWIPKPFTRARLEIGKPIRVAADADEAALEGHRKELQSSLDEMGERGQAWCSA